MNRESVNNEPSEQRRNPLLLALGAAAALLVVLILAGTVYGLATGSRQRVRERASQPILPEGAAVFSLGTVRATSADRNPAAVAATISFPYPSAEREFREELLKKAPALRAAAVSFFSRKTAAELHPAYEGAVKIGLREALNGLLSLGKIDELWLSDFAVLP